jgi:hypothetical protein
MQLDPSFAGDAATLPAPVEDAASDQEVSASLELASTTLDPTAVSIATDGVAPSAQPAFVPAGPAVPAAPLRPIPIPIPLQLLQGRYRATVPGWQVELRCDPDGNRPTGRVSADYYSVSGATVAYFGSMRLDAATISVTPAQVTISGLGTYTWSAGAPRVTVTLPRRSILFPHVAATLHHSTMSGSPGATYVCNFESPYLRSVLLEQDRQDTVPTMFSSYNTGSLPSPGAVRTLSVASAYAEHGIQMQDTGATDVVNTSEAGANGSWSDAELHAAMQRHFSRWVDLPQWAVWLFHAQLHDLGPSLLGIMFDQIGRQRQGCAVFYAGLGGASATQQRLQEYTCVHELGHCFNLMHSWQKSLATPPIPDRPGSPSYMNYPWRFPGGEAAFWSAFPFQFDDPELVHLRHAFRDDIIMGGANFGVGAALEAPDGWRDPISEDSGLKLDLSGPSSFLFGSPVSVDLALSATDSRGKRVAPQLKPEFGIVEIAIRKPSGAIVQYRPLMQRCVAASDVSLTAESPRIEDSVFIGYGQHGFYFDQPGFYQIRARYAARDGSHVLSNVLRVRVRPPLTADDDAAADLVFGDQQGTLFYLVGSDYEGLAEGRAALQQLREQYPSHPLAAYARLVEGVNSAREFKNVYADNKVVVRPANAAHASELLAGHLDLRSARALPNATPEAQVFLRARAAEITTELRGLPRNGRQH